MNKSILLITFLVLSVISLNAQKKFLFDASKAETAGNADWIIDADHWNLDYVPYATPGGNEANAQRFPTPSQNNITSSTSETYWKGALSSWGVELVKRGYQVETLPYNGQITWQNSNNPQDLSHYDVFVVCEPNIKFTSSEKKAIIKFVQNGGGLFMISDHDNSDRNGDGYDSPFIWNDLMFNNQIQNNPFGIKFNYEFFNENTYNIVNNNGNPITNGEYGKVTKVEFYGGTSMKIYPSANSSVKGVVFMQGSSTNGNNNILCAYSTFGNGKVVAIGDSSPADDGTGDNGDNLYNGWLEDANGNHRKLFMNGSVWLASGTTSVNDKEEMKNNINIFVENNKVYFKTGQNLNNASLSIYDISGKEIFKKPLPAGSSETSFNLYEKGVFIYRIISDNGIIATGKFIK